jgi:predicted RecB family nuclease
MTGKITAEVLEARLKCRYKAHLKMAGERGQPHDYELLQMESRGHVRAAARAKLLTRHPGVEAPQGRRLDAGLLKLGLPLLLDAAFEDDDFLIRFDALLRVEGGSPLGPFHYAPVLFDEAEKPTPELRLILAAHADLLGGVQGKVPARGVLMHGGGCQERKFDLAGVGKQARRLLRELRESSDLPAPRLTLNDHCQACEFRRRCHAEATTKDDLSLLRGLGEAEVAKYARRGIFTVAQLACTFRPPRRTNKPGQRKSLHSHALQALAVRERKVHVLGSPRLPESPKRLYLDLEGDPERGFCYLAGVVVKDGGRLDRHSFWIDSSEEEPVLLGRVLDLAATHPDAWVYAYGAYEAAFFRRAGKAAGREEEVTKLLARTFNVLSVIHLHAYFPVHCNGLKDVAGHLGFRWPDPEASGLMSVVWRRRWEQAGEPDWKDRLISYNLEDCEALRKVTEFLDEACPRPPITPAKATAGVEAVVARVEEMKPVVSSRREWCDADFAVPDFEFVNERAYFDYQRDRVYVRTSKVIRQAQARRRRTKGRKKTLRADLSAEVRSEACPFCGGVELEREPDGRLYRFAFDLKFGRGGVRKKVNRFTTCWHRCVACGERFLPPEYLRLDSHGHRLKCWAMYQHVAHRVSLADVGEQARDYFGLSIYATDVYYFKQALARRYEETSGRLLERIVAGGLIHADETEVQVKGVGKGYVWVFSNLEEVVFLYRPNREGAFLHDLLKGFRGVLVSDFYGAYDSLDCPQQKCLVHLIRDFNQDVQAHPWDEELKSLASSFGKLLRDVVATIDRHGLKARRLGRHRKDVDEFFAAVAGAEHRSELAEGYRGRLLRHRDSLFTFIGHDGIPWNNNNAEHAVKQFARYRKLVDGQFTEAGLKEYLVLLSVLATCKCKGVGFLGFMLSRQQDVDEFLRGRGRASGPPLLEVRPDGLCSPKRQRGVGRRQARRMKERSLSEAQRREVFLALVQAQDGGMTVQKSREEVARRFELPVRRVREVEREGLDARWPPLPGHDSASCQR